MYVSSVVKNRGTKLDAVVKSFVITAVLPSKHCVSISNFLFAAPVDYIPHNPIENPSFCQLFSSSSQLLLANGYSQA